MVNRDFYGLLLIPDPGKEVLFEFLPGAPKALNKLETKYEDHVIRLGNSFPVISFGQFYRMHRLIQDRWKYTAIRYALIIFSFFFAVWLTWLHSGRLSKNSFSQIKTSTFFAIAGLVILIIMFNSIPRISRYPTDHTQITRLQRSFMEKAFINFSQKMHENGVYKTEDLKLLNLEPK